jgi:hypothetical protein
MRFSAGMRESRKRSPGFGKTTGIPPQAPLITVVSSSDPELNATTRGFDRHLRISLATWRDDL